MNKMIKRMCVQKYQPIIPISQMTIHP